MLGFEGFRVLGPQGFRMWCFRVLGSRALRVSGLTLGSSAVLGALHRIIVLVDLCT